MVRFGRRTAESAGTNSEPASYLRLGPAGGVPGATSSELVSDQYDRYSIVSYTVDRPGNYSIADSRVELAGSSGDGVEVRVHVNSDAPRVHTATDIDSSNTEAYYRSNFDTSLGYLATGDQIYVAYGGIDDGTYDFFFTDFTIYRTSTDIVVADFVDDYTGNGSLAAGWEYFWNAPHGWQAGQSLGDLQTGSLSDLDSFQRLQPAGQAGFWTADRRSRGTNNGPSNFIRFGRAYGVPGAHQGMFIPDSTGQSESFVQNGLDRYAIASFTISNSGLYAITNSFLRTLSETNINGVEVRVFVNDENR